ncbi:STAS domain-containing protein [Kitasatospora sp. NPDC058406]|uniref:STAS domain-containing protein n=1 Tax=Kitasatospora sp. NPDC058406 TaxID=3346483 RepID=UPI00364669C3
MQLPAGEGRGPADDALEPGVLMVAARREGSVLIVALAGELDHTSADGLRTALAAPPEGGLTRIVVDLTDLRFCDSTGLNTLLRARPEAERAGLRLELAGPRGVVARLFEITGVNSVLRIHPGLDAAMGAGEPPDPQTPDRPSGHG